MIVTSTIQEYLDSKGFTYKETGSEARMNCPFCEDKDGKFFVNLETGAFKCFHENKCGRKGSFWELQKALGDEPERRAVMRPKKEYRRPEVKAHSLGAASTAFFAGRKISAETLSRFKIRQVSDGRIAFPYFKAGTCVNVKYRRLPKEFSQEKDCEPVLFGRDFANGSETLLVVEGEMDVLAAWEYQLVAVSVPEGAKATTWIAGEWDFLKRFKRIDLCLDNDEAGEEGVRAIVKRLGWDWDLRRVDLPQKDMNDCLMAGVSAEEIRARIDGARSLGPAEVKLLADIDFESVTAPDPGLPCEIPGLTEKLGGWRLGELTIHGGEGYAGKSTATMIEAAGALRRFKNVCVCNLEQKISSVVWTMIQQSGVNRADFLKCYGESLVFLDLHHSVEPGKLLELLRYAAKRYGCQFFTIDSFGCLEIPVSDYWLRQKEVMAQLARFAKDQDVHVHLVHHLRKPGGKDRSVNVDHADLEGSTWIRNLADNVILYRRIEDSDRKKDKDLAGTDEVLFVDKNRAFGTGGSIFLRFNPASKRFEEALPV